MTLPTGGGGGLEKVLRKEILHFLTNTSPLGGTLIPEEHFAGWRCI